MVNPRKLDSKNGPTSEGCWVCRRPSTCSTWSTTPHQPNSHAPGDFSDLLLEQCISSVTNLFIKDARLSINNAVRIAIHCIVSFLIYMYALCLSMYI